MTRLNTFGPGALVGLWSQFADPDAGPTDTFTLMMQPAYPPVDQIHDRAPIKADRGSYGGKADSDFAALNKSLSDTQTQLKATKTEVSFKMLKDRLAAFYQRQSQTGKTDSGR